MSDALDQPEGDTVACKICATSIPATALYCTNCSNYQNTVRRFLAGIDIRSMLALIPVATLALVFVRDALITPEADLRIAPLSCQDDRIRIAAANLGNRDALFAGALIRGGNIDKPIPLNLLGDTSEARLLVKAGGTHVYDLEAVDANGEALGLMLHNKAACDYEVKLNALAFDEPHHHVARFVIRPSVVVHLWQTRMMQSA